MSFTIPPANKIEGQGGIVPDLDNAYAALAAVAGFNVQNAAYAGGAKGDGTTDDTAAIAAALSAAGSAGGGVVYLPPGTYKISSALTIPSKVTIAGAGMDATTISQVTTSAHGITGTDVSKVTIRDLTINGPGSGSGNGVNLVRSGASSIPQCSFERVQAATFGNCGFKADVLIVSRFAGCTARSNGGDGFQLTSAAGNTTSTSLTSCYANTNAGIGYELDSCIYCSLTACAADHNAGGAYALFGGQSCTLTGCGAEANTGTNVLLQGGIGNTVNGLWVNVNAGIGVSLASGEVDATLTGCVENSPSGATAWIKTVTGTSCVVINDKHTTANSFAAGTAYEILFSGGATH